MYEYTCIYIYIYIHAHAYIHILYIIYDIVHMYIISYLYICNPSGAESVNR